jgi:type I restriction enzyme S subunit
MPNLKALKNKSWIFWVGLLMVDFLTSIRKSYPERWDVRRIKYVMEKNKELREESERTEVSFCPMSSIGETGKLNTSMIKISGDIGSGYTRFEDGDVIIAKITPCFENGKGALARNLRNGIGYGTTELFVVRHGNGLDPRFLYYATASSTFRTIGEAFMTGAAGQKRVPGEFVADFLVGLPDQAIQQSIADYLDQETARIDELVAEKEKMLALLEEKRNALITNTVTRGLDPKAKMKDSGIEWLGQIPSHWHLLRLRFLGHLKGGSGFPHDHQGQTDGEIPFFKVKDLSEVREGDLAASAENYISYDTADLLGANVFPDGAIIFAKIGAALLLRRYRILAHSACVDNNMMGLVLDEGMMLPSFAALLLPLLDLQIITNPGAVPSLDVEKFKDKPLPVPPILEQEKITAQLQTEINETRQLRDGLSKSIELLQERRIALITAAVTGQIDVAGIN